MPKVQDIHSGDGLKNPINRLYSTNAAEPWHVDDADVVGEHHHLKFYLKCCLLPVVPQPVLDSDHPLQWHI